MDIQTHNRGNLETIHTMENMDTRDIKVKPLPSNLKHYFTAYDTIMFVSDVTRYLEHVNENKYVASRVYGKSVINDTRDISSATCVSRIVAQRNGRYHFSFVRENRVEPFLFLPI